MDSDPRTTPSRAQRAAVGLSVLAAALLACGGAVEAAGNLFGPTADAGGGGGTRPATVLRPTFGPPTVPPTVTASPSPSCPLPTPPLPTPPPPTPQPEPSGTATTRGFPTGHPPGRERTPPTRPADQ